MHKKGAKLSLVHLFGLSKINRNYIQKGREIRRNMKRMKKVLSIVLSLAMILTSITIYDAKTTKADEGDVAEIKFTAATKPTKENTLIDAYWEKVENSSLDKVYIYDATEGEAINKNTELKSEDSAVSSNGDWCWNDKDGATGQKADMIYKNKSGTINTKNGGDYIVVVVSYDSDGNLLAFGKTTITTIKYSTTVTNTKLNLTGKNHTEIGDEKPIFIWNSVAKAEKYVLTATDDITGNIIKTWEITDNLTKELSFDAKEVQNGSDGTYTMKIVAYDEDGKEIEADADDITSVSKCKKFYSTNKYLKFRSNGKEATVLESDGPTLNWDVVDGAESYKIVATDDKTGTVLKEWTLGKTVTKLYFWNSDVKDGNSGTYTLTITAYDANGQAITPMEDDVYVIKNCAKYFKFVDPDVTTTGVEQTGYTKAEDINDWIQLYGRTEDGATAWISESVYNKMSAHECNGLLKKGNTVDGKVKYNISVNLNNVDVFAFVASGGNPTSIVINGTRYNNASTNTLVYIGNDCVYINQSLLTIPDGESTAEYIITPEGSKGTPAFVLQLRKDERLSVSIDNEVVDKIVAEDTYKLPEKENVKCYYGDGKFYKPGTQVQITKNMSFVSITDISANLTNGAAIRIDADKEAGIRFKANIDVTCGVDSEKDNIINALQAGLLITTQDKLDSAEVTELNLDNIEKIGTVLNVKNSGWFNGEVGSYCASLINIVKANYPRTFVARAYAKVTFSDGAEDYVYSQDNGTAYANTVSRSIKGIAEKIIADADEFKEYNETIQNLIKKFAE